MSNQITVSHSEVDTFVLCQRRWYYGYGLGIERIKHSDAQSLGTLGHKAQEVYLSTLMDNGKYSEALKATDNFLMASMDGENSNTVKTLANIFRMQTQVKPFAGYEILAIEKEFVLNIDDNVSYPFVVDAILRDSQGKVAILDHKFTYDFYQPSVLNILPQLPKYIAALRAMNLPADFGMYLFLRYRNIKNPTPDQIVQLQNMFFTDERIVRTFKEQLQVTERIIDLKSKPIEELSDTTVRVGNSMVCKTCSFNSICSAELSGYNTAAVMRTEYKQRERRTFVTKEAE